MRGWKEVAVFKSDLIKYRSMNTEYDFGLMWELKSQGAPILGKFNLRPDMENYEWRSRESESGDALFYSWRTKHLQDKN